MDFKYEAVSNKIREILCCGKFEKDMPNMSHNQICYLFVENSIKFITLILLASLHMATFVLSNINLQVNGISFPQ